MSPFSWLVVAMFVAPLFLLVVNVFRLRASKSELDAYVRAKGYAFLNPPATNAAGRSQAVRAMSGLADIDRLDHGADYSASAFVCRLRGQEVTIFNATSSSSRVDSTSNDVHYRVAKIKRDGLPQFSIGRHGAVEWVQKLYDRLAETPDSSLDRGDAPAFFKKYWMKGPDGAAVYGFLTPRKLDYLASKDFAGTLASNGQYLVYFESQTRAMRSSADYDRFIAEVDDLISHLL